LDFLGPEFSWVADFTDNYQVETSILKKYIFAYYQAAKKILDDRGQILIDWLFRNYQKIT
jgi:hypothetical protein